MSRDESGSSNRLKTQSFFSRTDLTRAESKIEFLPLTFNAVAVPIRSNRHIRVHNC
jgi:hypothetical protein